MRLWIDSLEAAVRNSMTAIRLTRLRILRICIKKDQKSILNLATIGPPCQQWPVLPKLWGGVA